MACSSFPLDSLLTWCSMVVATRRAPAAAATDVGTPRRGRRAAREPSPEPVEEEMASESESIADEEPEVDGAAVDDDDVDSEDDLEALADAVDASSSATYAHILLWLFFNVGRLLVILLRRCLFQRITAFAAASSLFLCTSRCLAVLFNCRTWKRTPSRTTTVPFRRVQF